MKFKEGEKVRAVKDVRVFKKLALTKGNTYDVFSTDEFTVNPDHGEAKTIETVSVLANDGMPLAFNAEVFEKNSKYRVGDVVTFDKFGQELTKRTQYRIKEVDLVGDRYVYTFRFAGGNGGAVLEESHITGLYEEKLEEKPVESDGDKKSRGLQKAIHDKIASNALDAARYVFEENISNPFLIKAFEFDPSNDAQVNDPVTHPAHYNQGGIEAIDALEAATCNLSGWKATLTYQSMKYLWRWNEKGRPLEDLKKARFYLDRLISKVEKETKEEK